MSGTTINSKSIRRFRSGWPGSRNSPTTSGTAGTGRRARCSRACTPSCGTRSATARRPSSSASTRSAWKPPPTIRYSSAPLNRVLSAYDTYHRRQHRRAAWPPLAQGRPDRLLLRRIRLPREPADLLRRPRHPRRRPLQGGERPAPAVRRRRPALPPGLFPADASTATAISSAHLHRFRLRRPADHAGHCDADGGELHVTVDLPGRDGAGQGLASAVGHVTLYLLDTDLRENSAARPRHRAPALRRRPHDAHRAGNRARHRRRARAARTGPQAHGLAHQRRPRRVPGARAHSRS